VNITLADAAQLVAITVAVLLVFFRSARFMKQVTDAINASEERLRNEIAASADRLRSENREAHAAITRNIDDVKQDVREVKQDIRMLTQHLLHRDGADRLQGPST
jgi:F0F1-type ATP synthase membrane subunit b/b'